MKIRRVTVENFRGIRSADWRLPRQRFLCLVGPGDSTKSTLLDAIALVLTARSAVVFSDADFFECDTSRSVVIRVVIGDLTDELLSHDTGFGLWLTGLSADGGLEHDPQPGSESCVMLQLAVDADLEPSWTVVRLDEYGDGLPLTGGRRRALGLFRMDERIDTHLRWGRSSALARMSEKGADAAVTAVRRAARETVFAAVGVDLQATASRVATAAGAIGGGEYPMLRPGWDPVAAASPSALVLHDGVVPLTHAGLGSRRLVSIAAQELATLNGNLLLIDEIEHGLEPHRLLHILNELRKRSDRQDGQIVITTHSPIAVQALTATDLCVVRSDDGVTQVRAVPDNIASKAQGALRAGPSAILARKAVIGEGATEAGILRTLIRSWDVERIGNDLPTSAALGVTSLNGGGANAPIRAKVYHELGVHAALLVDNDDRGVDKAIAAAAACGVLVARWERDQSTEAAIISGLTEPDDLRRLLDLASAHKSSDGVRIHLRRELTFPDDADVFSSEAWAAAGHSIADVVTAMISAARGGSAKVQAGEESNAWFKREDAGEALGEFILDRWAFYETTQLGSQLSAINEFIYGGLKENTDADKP